MNASDNRLAEILAKAASEQRLGRADIVFLLGLKQKRHIDAVFRVARQMRLRHFGKRVFLYGFIYISTYCRNRCRFCYYRSGNRHPVHYRRKASEIIEAAQSLADSGVHLIDLTMGEDPQYFQDQGFDSLIQLVKTIRRATGLSIMVSPGVVSPEALSDFVAAGVDWYACYQETHNRQLFKRLRPGQSFTERFERKELAARSGLLTEEGLLCGVGESHQDIADSIEKMHLLEASQMRAMSFIPQKGTPLQSWKNPDPMRELMVIAVLRLVFPDRLIPATLDIAGLAGLQSRLEAGANVVTSLVPPGFGLAGVAQASLDITAGRRFTAGIIPELEKLGMQSATSEDYSRWIDKRQQQIRFGLSGEKAAC